ncbi:WXG100 family type VII secretion target [Mycobacterium sp.]|uniref:WXG100 family type VII secretion target n=1 Tax=Mycobacterium sp. TaxID=1785 RepID=UPI003D6A74CA
MTSFGNIQYDHGVVDDLGSGVGNQAAILLEHHDDIKHRTDQIAGFFQGQAHAAFYEAQIQMLRGFEGLIETVAQHGQTIHTVNASAHATDLSSANFFV